MSYIQNSYCIRSVTIPTHRYQTRPVYTAISVSDYGSESYAIIRFVYKSLPKTNSSNPISSVFGPLSDGNDYEVLSVPLRSQVFGRVSVGLYSVNMNYSGHIWPALNSMSSETSNYFGCVW